MKDPKDIVNSLFDFATSADGFHFLQSLDQFTAKKGPSQEITGIIGRC